MFDTADSQFGDNLFKMIHARSFFDPSQDSSNDVHDGSVVSDTADNSITNQATQNNIWSMPSPALDAYKKHMGNMPTEDQYKPSKTRKVLAAIAGISTMNPEQGYKLSKGIADEPYNEALGKYKMKGQQLGELADIESKDFTNRLAAQEKMRADTRADTEIGLKKDTLNETKRKNDMQAKHWNEQNASSGWTAKTDETTGKLIRVNTRTGEVAPIDIKVAETPQEKDTRARGLEGYKSNLQFGNQSRLVGMRGEEARKTGEANRLFDAAHPISNAKPTVLMPSQQNAAFTGAMRETLIDHPEYNKFVDPKTETLKAPQMETVPHWYGDTQTNQADIDLYKKFTKDISDKAEAKAKIATAGNPLNVAKNTAPPKVDRAAVIAELTKHIADKTSPLFGRTDLLTNEKYIASKVGQ